MARPRYDMFEHESPHRPRTSHDEAPPIGVDELLHANDVVNFSRKRELREQLSPYAQDAEHSAKRHRSTAEDGEHSSWRPRSTDWAAADGEETPKQTEGSPTRISKFREASMRDKPSDTPPSLFTRHFNAHAGPSHDELMHDYHTHTDKPLPAHPTSMMVAGSVGTRQAMGTARNSEPVAYNAPASGDEAVSAEGAMFKFGKSMATAFNPINVWTRFTSSWRMAKDELASEAHDAQDAQQRELNERQRKAEQAYAELKLAGKLGSQGSHTLSGAPIFTPGYSQPALPAEMRGRLLPRDESPDKAQRHTRTPSFHTLKKMASEFSLHRRSGSGSTSMSPFKEGSPVKEDQLGRMRHSKSRGNVFELFGGEERLGSIRSRSKGSLLQGLESTDQFASVRSRKDLTKQAKLSKRVSDLEAKLNLARSELDKALAVAPPVPHLPPPAARRASGQAGAIPHEVESAGASPSKESASGFVPALPTLLSESLLLPLEPTTHHADQANAGAGIDAVRSEEASVASSDAPMLQEGHGNSMYMQPNMPLLKAEFESSPPSKENVPGTSERKSRLLPALPDPGPKTPEAAQTFLADPSSPRTESPKKIIKSTLKKGGGKAKRKSQDEKAFRPDAEDLDDDAEWDEGKPKTLRKNAKKRSPGDATSSSPKRARSSKLPVASNSPTAKTKEGVLKKPVSTPASVAPTPEPSFSSVIPSTRAAGLESVEEVPGPGTTIVPVKSGSPRRPTAKATPAFPRHGRYGSNSPASVARKRYVTPKPDREYRSPSPPPSSTLGTFMQEDDVVMVARPNGKDVPPMPGQGSDGAGTLHPKSSFEWPEDVF